MKTLKELIEGKLVTKLECEDGVIIFHIGKDEAFICLQPIMVRGAPAIGYAAEEFKPSSLQ
jgi:hypothetical protein